MKRLFTSIPVVIRMVATFCVWKEKCPRSRAIQILSSQAMEYTGAHWAVANLRLMQARDGIVIFFLDKDGKPSESIALERADPLVFHLRMKMNFAERRFKLRAA